MILEEMDFTEFYVEVREIFSDYFTDEETEQLMEYVDILSDANFRCYKANMIVIAERKDPSPNVKLIADMEWVARSVGEYRVSSKARINKYISDIRSTKEPLPSTLVYTYDDIVYSIGEMMDRLSIETIKLEDFRVNKRAKHMTVSVNELRDRVKRYLITKLDEIKAKGFYECVHEQRTYDLEGIVEELVI